MRCRCCTRIYITTKKMAQRSFLRRCLLARAFQANMEDRSYPDAEDLVTHRISVSIRQSMFYILLSGELPSHCRGADPSLTNKQANFYLTFYFIAGSLSDPKLDPFGHNIGLYIFVILRFACVLLICCQFILSMGNRPQG